MMMARENSGEMREAKSTGVLVGPDLNPSRTPLDKKLYRQILLPNGLRALLISDTVAIHQQQHHSGGGYYCSDSDDEESSSKDEEDSHDNDDSECSTDDEGLRDAAAAVLVGVGSMYDPPELQGLAHFLEHMLFMGTEKFPDENAFDAFLSKSGGSDNAYTDFEQTVYHLEIPQESFFQALDMLAQFFIRPLMLEDAVERELNSIESEFQLCKRGDDSRSLGVMAQTCGHDEHPFASFSWGNLKSLKDIPEKNGVNVMEELRKFYDQYYYASNMRLAVIGAYSLDELEERVVSYFSNVPAEPRQVSPIQPQIDNAKSWDGTYHSAIARYKEPFKATSMGVVYRIVPVNDAHTLTITWQLPPQFSNWKSKPGDYLSHLLGHESKGSVLSSLKSKSWVTALYAGIGDQGFENASSHALFSISISLSVEGASNWIEVAREVFAYIGMLRYHCLHELPLWIYEELKSIQQLSYRYEDESPAEDLVQELVEEMAPHQALPPERLLDGSSLLFEYDKEAIKDLLNNYLVPSNARFDLMSSAFGRSTDFSDEVEETLSLSADIDMEAIEPDDDGKFSPELAGPPLVDPIFGTRFWCHRLTETTLNLLGTASLPRLDPSSCLCLPPPNPFVPTNFELKPLPPHDSHHPLVRCSLKVCVLVGKRKSWFPATATKYDSTKNLILLSYEDEDEKWHKVDAVGKFPHVSPNFEGTFDDKQLKYRVVAAALEGQEPTLKFGDDSDHHVEEGMHFPPIPPAMDESRLPQLVVDNKTLKFWYLQDRRFKRPCAEFRIRIICAAARSTPLEDACTDLLVILFDDAVSEICYLASICELGSSIQSSVVGLILRVHGFNDKLLNLVELLVKRLFSFRGRKPQEGLPDIEQKRFDACFEQLQRRYANHGLRASKLCSDVRLRCLQKRGWSSHAKSKALQDLSTACFVETISGLLSRIHVEAFYHGNVDVPAAEVAANMLTRLINESGGGGLSRKQFPSLQVIQIPLTTTTALHTITVPAKDPDEPNTAIEYYLQVDRDNLMQRVLIDVIIQIMSEPFYDQLRSKDQFGYDVSCDSRWTFGVIGMHLRVVTSTKDATETTIRIERFLAEFRKHLQDMTQDDFMQHVIGLAKSKLLAPTWLEEECDNLWAEICDFRYEWQIQRNEVLCLKSITKEQVLEAYDDYFMPENGIKRRVLVVQVIGTKDKQSSFQETRPLDVGEFVVEQIRAFQAESRCRTWGNILLKTD